MADVNQGCSLSERRTNFATPSPLDGDGEGEGEYSSQQRAVGLVFAVGVVVGVVINFANLHTDFQVYIMRQTSGASKGASDFTCTAYEQNGTTTIQKLTLIHKRTVVP